MSREELRKKFPKDTTVIVDQWRFTIRDGLLSTRNGKAKEAPKLSSTDEIVAAIKNLSERIIPSTIGIKRKGDKQIFSFVNTSTREAIQVTINACEGEEGQMNHVMSIKIDGHTGLDKRQISEQTTEELKEIMHGLEIQMKEYGKMKLDSIIEKYGKGKQ